ncbi:hypothetical protein HZC00_04605 [Candidatus Kaiserbacteria bacterium]|nr:hypothetical protein [Candidatus Kaiserbacteria bacterium]
MFIFERFIFVLIGLAFICAGLLGAALYYHFSRFSPDQDVATKTMIIYGAGVGLLAIITLIMAVIRL